MSETTAPRARLSEAQRLLLEKRLKGQARPAATGAGRIRPRAGGNVLPMSWAQERLWFLDQLEPGNAFYNIPAAALVSARIDVPRLERVFSEIVRRHEALRTVFRMEDGAPKQIVQDPFPIRVETGDLRGADGAPADEAEVRRFIARDGARPFDLATGPLLRVGIFRVSAEDAALLINVHHIVTDGWSMPIIMREMEELYEAYSAGRPSPLPELEVQYADYSLWQREYLTGETLSRQVGYWRGHLEGAPVLELPTDRPRPPVLSHRGGMYRFVWPAVLTATLRGMMVETGATLNMVVMAAYYLMLHRYAGQEDVVVGTLLGNRNRAEVEPLVGFFVNSAPVRVRVEPDVSFRELVRRVRGAVLDADAHQDLPFDRIVDALKAERDPSRNPLFQVMYFHHTFVRQFHHRDDSDFRSELNIRSLFQETGVTLVDTEASKFDQTFATIEMDDGVLANMVEYSTDLWDEDSIARMMDHVRVLLEGAAVALDAPLRELPMLSPQERDRVLAWGMGPDASPAAPTLAELFEASVRRAPQATALEHADASLTYAELDERSARLARRLLARGVRPGDRVGVAAVPSAATATAIVAVVRAGAAAVPLDPAYPAERLAFMAADAEIRLLLARGAPPETLAGVEVPSLDLDAPDDDGTLDVPLPAPDADAAAYLTYTSGSTGRPKAVLTTQGALARTVSGEGIAVPLLSDDRVMQAVSLSFDVGAWELWAPLAAGAASVAVDRDALLSAEGFAAALRERRITAAFLTTQLFARHVRTDPAVFSRFRQVMFGGEAADPAAVRACLEGGAPARLVNGYGPTEAAVVATTQEIHALGADAASVPIGRPVASTRAYVVDVDGRLAGVGVPGELWLGGERIAPGYVARPELTAERFVADPFDPRPGARAYRTGDRVRWLPDGTLEFLGRLDAQVKVRGFRIEPGEIEAVLRGHPAVRDAAVVAREEPGGERRLVAYTVGVGGADELRAFLKERLPDHLVPSAFVVVDEIPLTPNGKLDRRRLPAPDAAAAPADGYVAPSTDAERVLAAVWAEVLRLPRVGAHDNFFALGGDSILSIQVIARAAQEGVRVTPKQLFVHQTVAELAAVAGTAPAAAPEEGPVTGEVPLTPVQRWWLEQGSPEPHHFNLAEVVETDGPVDVARLERAAAAVLDHHDLLRARFRRVDGGWHQEIAPPGTAPAVEQVDLSGVAPGEREAAFTARAAEAQRRLRLEEGPLVRWALFDLGDTRRLLTVAHHLVADAVSLPLLRADLEAAYDGRPLAPRTTSFRRWAELLAEHARSDAAGAELAYWTEAASGLAGDALPVGTEGASEVHAVTLEAAATRALLHDVPAAYGARMEEALLAALALAFRRTGGAPAPWIDREGHGREDLFEGVDLSRTVGWFTAIHPLRLEAPDDADGALRTLKERVRSVPARGIGWGLLRWMGDDATRDRLAALPRPAASFNYLGQVDGRAGASSWRHAEADAGPSRAPAAPRTHPLAIDALVADGELHASWSHDPSVLPAETVGRLAAAFLDALREIAVHVAAPGAGGYTPSDFDLAELDQEALDAVLSQLDPG